MHTPRGYSDTHTPNVRSNVHAGPCPIPENRDCAEAYESLVRERDIRIAHAIHASRLVGGIMFACAAIITPVAVSAGVYAPGGSECSVTIVVQCLMAAVGIMVIAESAHENRRLRALPIPRTMEHRCIRSLVTGGRECTCRW